MNLDHAQQTCHCVQSCQLSFETAVLIILHLSLQTVLEFIGRIGTSIHLESGEKNLALEIICHVLNGLNSDSPSPVLDILSNVSSALIFCCMMLVHSCPHTNEYKVLIF